MKLILLGPPGAGKGTLASLLKNSLDLLHLSTGDILREEMKNHTALGGQVEKLIETGQLVPDEIVTKLIEQKILSTHSNQGFLFDGFPRTLAQAAALDRILQKSNKPLDYALYLESTLPVVIHRLGGRRVCGQCGGVFHITNRPPRRAGICDKCGADLQQRADDNEAAIRTRMEIYLTNTQPIVDYYQKQGKLKRLNSDRESEEVYGSLMKMFNESSRSDSN